VQLEVKPAAAAAEAGHAAIGDVASLKEHTLWSRLFSSQAFWVTVALLLLYSYMAYIEPTFRTPTNLGNMARNFAPFAIMALGMTIVIITGGIDLSIGSILGLVAIVAGLFLTWHYPWYVAFFMGLVAGLAAGAVNGYLIAYIGMSPFVVTLGMLSIARSLAVVFSGNQMLYQFGPDAPIVKGIGQAKWPVHTPVGSGPDWMPELSSHFWAMVIMGLLVSYVLNFKALGRHLYSIGGNEQAARLTGVPVDRVKFGAYVFSGFCTAVASLLLLGYNGSAINAMGQSYELRVIAGSIIGGTVLAGGYGTAFGAIVGSALLELIRNALIMAGVDSNWQGAFVGCFIILAVLLGMQSGGRPLVATWFDKILPKRQRS
jgi:ribose transport system permease protein